MCIYAIIFNTYFESKVQHHKTLTNDNAEDLPEYDGGHLAGFKTTAITFKKINGKNNC